MTATIVKTESSAYTLRQPRLLVMQAVATLPIHTKAATETQRRPQQRHRCLNLPLCHTQTTKEGSQGPR